MSHKSVYKIGARSEAAILEKTRLISFEQGEVLGRQKGEVMGRRKVALWMLNQKNFSIEDIVQATSFSLEELKQLQQTN